jgi:hypothetical protein
MLSIRGTNFIAHCAYAERISLLAEHTRNGFHRWPSMRGNVKKSNISAEWNLIFKNLVLQALGTIRFRFLQKNSTKKIHACVPLKNQVHVVPEVMDPVAEREIKIFQGRIQGLNAVQMSHNHNCMAQSKISIHERCSIDSAQKQILAPLQNAAVYYVVCSILVNKHVVSVNKKSPPVLLPLLRS